MIIPEFKLERYFAKYEFNVRYLLCASDCESLAIRDLLALEPEAAERFQQHWLGYTDSLGAAGLRQAVSQIYTTLQPEQVLVCSGAEEAIFLFMQAALQPGEHVIVHWPCYQSLAELPRSLGCQVTLWKAREENGWALDVDEFEHSLRADTKAVIVNNPHNPTGALMSQADFARLNQICQARGILLFSDEVYRELEHDPALRLPAACDINPLAVSLGVTSKTYGLAGLRIGWIATHNQAILARMAALKDYTTICSSAPSEFLAEVALRHRRQLAQRNLEIILRNLDILDGFFSRHADLFAWQRPRAGSIAFPRLTKGEIEDFCDRLVRQAGVLLLPGTLFEDEGNHFRIGFGRQNMLEGVRKLEANLRM